MDRRPGRSEQPFSALLLAAILVLSGTSTARAQTIQEAIELHLAGRLDEALEAYGKVTEATENSDPPIAAAAYTNACLIRMNRSEYELALEACEAALRLRRLSDDQVRMARTLNNLGLTLQNLGRYEESKERFLEALEINRASGDPLSTAQNLSNLSGLAIQAGDYRAALDRVAGVLELSDAHPGAEWRSPQRRFAFLNEGVALEKLGAFRAALESYRKALAEEGPVDESLQALLKTNTGVVYRNLGDPVRAIELFQEAAIAYRRLENTSGLSNAILNTALALHLNLRRPIEAEAAYREALALAVGAGDRPEEIQDLFYLASLLLEQGRLAESEELFERALTVAEASGSAEGRWSALAGLGRIAAARGESIEAERLLGRALEVIEEMRADLTPETHRADFFGDKRSVFEAAVRAAADLHQQQPEAGHDEAAFTLVQRAKARELLDALGEERAGRPLDPEQVAAELQRGELVEYFLADGDLIRWTLSEHGLRMTALGSAEPILSAVTRVHRALAGRAAPAPDDLTLLADRLLATLETPTNGPLYIAADGPLRYLPFGLLPLPGDQGSTLLDRAPLAYLPSASALALLGSDREPPALRTVGLANPSLDRGLTSRPAALIAARFGLGELPSAEQELADLERWLGGPSRLLTGASATEVALREALQDGARVIHLATHTVIDERPGRGAAVLLTATDIDDGLLYPREIASLDLRADLAVLAACRTALGSVKSGNSLATLTGAFLAAGSKAVVATLWDVDDDVTAAFMNQFYWQLGRGVEPAEALRQAKQSFRERPEWRQPHLWAGYMLTGRTGPVIDRISGEWWIAGGILVVAIALLVLNRWRA